MKQTIIILLATAIAASCTKSSKGPSSNTCICTYTASPNHDTTVKYSVSPGNAQSECTAHETTLKSIAGQNGASCYLY